MWSTWASRSGISSSSPPRACSSSATLRRRLSARRKWSMPRRFAVVISHAPGFAGMPVVGHCSSAATSASCARSSASSTSRVIRVRAPTRRADSARHAAMMASVGSSATGLLPARGQRSERRFRRRAPPGRRRSGAGSRPTVTSGQCFACRSANSCWSATASSRVAYSMMRPAADDLLGLGVRPVDPGDLALADDEVDGVLGAVEPAAVEEDARWRRARRCRRPSRRTAPAAACRCPLPS